MYNTIHKIHVIDRRNIFNVNSTFESKTLEYASFHDLVVTTNQNATVPSVAAKVSGEMLVRTNKETEKLH